MFFEPFIEIIPSYLSGFGLWQHIPAIDEVARQCLQVLIETMCLLLGRRDQAVTQILWLSERRALDF